MENKDDIILSVNNLHVSFKTDDGLVHAVRGVSFDLHKGETLCIVGESGSGKSVTSKTIMGILSANAVIESGSVIYEGEDLTMVDESEFHRIRGHKIGMIFQDPLSSLNPIMRVGKQITEAMLVNSDLMKRRYDSLISKEEAAFKSNEAVRKNTKLQADRLIENSDESFDKQIYALERHYNEVKFGSETAFKKAAEIQSKLNTFRIHKEKKIFNESDITEDQVASLEEEKNNRLEEGRKLLAESIQVKKDNAVAKADLKAKKKAEHKRLSALAKETYREADAKYMEAAPALKAALIAKKKDARIAIVKYKKDEKLKYLQTLADLEKEKQNILAEEKAGSRELFARLDENEKAKEKATARYKSLFRISRAQAKARALKVMKEVGIPQPEARFKQYPFEFSGGMRQRIVIAIALTANPEILICDEPTTALDVTIQAQILELINKLKAERNMSVIFISHDLGVVANMGDRVAVMYAGKVVEVGTAEEIFYDPRHPYTWALLSSIPDIDSHEKLEAIPGTPPYLLNPPKGDAFAARNKYAMAIDFEKEPPFFKISDTHYAATWLLDKRAPKAKMPKIVAQRIKASLEREEKSHE